MGGALWSPVGFPLIQQGHPAHPVSECPLPAYSLFLLKAIRNSELSHLGYAPVFLEGRTAKEEHLRELEIWSELWNSSLPKNQPAYSSETKFVKWWEKPLHECLSMCCKREKIFCVCHRQILYLSGQRNSAQECARQKWSRLGNILTPERVSAWRIGDVQYLTT